MINHLRFETSPHLQQHADDPVNWYPWGQEALTRARAEDKPIFLSIGYSACHWCHVMAHESFQDERIAEILNRHFISIKVDREERPDLDQIYMGAVVALTGSGGWPMSVFCTSEGRPFFGGTYFPPTPRSGMPSLAQVLHAVVEAWQKRRSEIEAGSRQIVAALAEHNSQAYEGHEGLRWGTIEAAFGTLSRSFDEAHGGWGDAPKFPQPMILEFLLRYHRASGKERALVMVNQTMEQMARGGMYDQLGGGFHRYSVDNRWLIPHFEKMLYDQSQLARVYLHAWQVTGNQFFRAITEEILDYVAREMLDPHGGFYSTQDADSEGEEGKFFVWTADEIREALGGQADDFIAAYGITRSGNFEGKNILEFVGDMDRRPALLEARRALFQVREKRGRPGRDEKVLTSWNGLMLAAFAEAGRILDRDEGSRALAARYRQVAERNADFILSELRQGNGRLLRTWQASEAKLNGYLEDYSYLIEGLLELYQTTFDPRWFVAARELTETILEHFQAPDGGLYDTSDDHETLIARPRDMQDNATPSGNAMAVTALLKLGGLTHDPRYVDTASQLLAGMQSMMERYPLAFGQWLQAAVYALSRPVEIAIVGDPCSEDTLALLAVARDGYRPFQVVGLGAPGTVPGVIGLLEGRGLVDGRAAAYVCRSSVCKTPATEAEELMTILRREESG